MQFLRTSNIFFIILLGSSLPGCGFVSGQLHDKAMEEQLLKPGALDSPLTGIYDTYSFKFLNKYQITHEFPRNSSGCRYAQKPTRGAPLNNQVGELYAGTDIFELNDHTWQLSSHPDKPFNIDHYVRPEWQSTDGKGNVRTNKGFQPMCNEGWVSSSHGLTIYLMKMSLNDAIKRHTKPDVSLQEQSIGANRWIMQEVPLMPRTVNTIAGWYLTSILPIEDTGYTFVFSLGANQDSLKHPEAHARMQEIFRHLIESVKIEPITVDAK